MSSELTSPESSSELSSDVVFPSSAGEESELSACEVVSPSSLVESGLLIAVVDSSRLAGSWAVSPQPMSISITADAIVTVVIFFISLSLSFL